MVFVRAAAAGSKQNFLCGRFLDAGRGCECAHV